MAASLVPLSEQENGTIHLEDGSPAARARARVFVRRKDELVEAPVYADQEKSRRLSQPLTADAQGRLPGLIHDRPIEVEATWRGRTITTAAIRAQQDEAQREHEAEDAARVEFEDRIAEEAQRDAESRMQAEREAAEAATAQEDARRAEEQEFRRLERATVTEREMKDAAEIEARDRAAIPAESFSLSPTISRRDSLTVVIIDKDLTEVAEITVRDYEPGYDSTFSMDVFEVALGFGIDSATGLPYSDPGGPDEGEAAVFGIVQPYGFWLVTP